MSRTQTQNPNLGNYGHDLDTRQAEALYVYVCDYENINCERLFILQCVGYGV